MKIGYDAKRLTSNSSGLGRYSDVLIHGMIDRYPNHEYYLFTPGKTPFKNHTKQLHWIRPNIKTPWWRSLRISGLIDRHELDIYHGLSHELPFFVNHNKTKYVLTVHDTIFKVRPNDFTWIDRAIYQKKLEHSITHADHILCISNHTKNDLYKYFKINPEKVSVIYQSAAPHYYTPIAHKRPIDLPERYLLMVGNIEPRKNIDGVIKSQKHIPHNLRIPLVIVGKGKAGYLRHLKKLLHHEDPHIEVQFHHQVSDELLPAYYQYAEALVYPSHYEGFGLPVLEASLLGCPVVVSNSSSLPEVAPPSGILVFPDNPKSIGQGLTELLIDTEKMKEKAKHEIQLQRKRFHPDHYIKRVSSIYQNLVKT